MQGMTNETLFAFPPTENKKYGTQKKKKKKGTRVSVFLAVATSVIEALFALISQQLEWKNKLASMARPDVTL
jgi:hypothetical protein